MAPLGASRSACAALEAEPRPAIPGGFAQTQEREDEAEVQLRVLSAADFDESLENANVRALGVPATLELAPFKVIPLVRPEFMTQFVVLGGSVDFIYHIGYLTDKASIHTICLDAGGFGRLLLFDASIATQC